MREQSCAEAGHRTSETVAKTVYELCTNVMQFGRLQRLCTLRPSYAQLYAPVIQLVILRSFGQFIGVTGRLSP